MTRCVLRLTLPSLAGPFGATSEHHLVLARAQLRTVRRSTAQSPLQLADIVFHVHPECLLSPPGPHLSSLTHPAKADNSAKRGFGIQGERREFHAGLTVAKGSDVGQVVCPLCRRSSLVVSRLLEFQAERQYFFSVSVTFAASF